MKIIALSRGDPLSDYIVRRVHQVLPLDAAVRVLPSVRQRPRLKKVLGWLQGGFAYVLEHHLFYRRFYERQNQLVTRDLADELPVLPEVRWQDISAEALHSEETASWIRGLQPDVLLVCSAPLLKSSIFTIPRIATLNVHCGMSPHYRGEHSLFWPLLFKDYERLGVTIHRIDAGIDTGSIVSQATLQRDETDTETTLLAKATRLSAELVIDTLILLETNPAAGVRQSPGGRQFNFRARRIWHDLRLNLRRLRGAGKLPRQGEQRWFNGLPLDGVTVAQPTQAVHVNAKASGA